MYNQSTAAWLVAFALFAAAPLTQAQTPAAPPADAPATDAQDADSTAANGSADDAASRAQPAAAEDAQAPAASAATPAPAAANPDAARTSEVLPNAATQGLILDLTETNSRAVAVGERGQILVSESRSDWRQIANVPTRATLTAVTAVGEDVWAVGHDGTIVHSADGGLAWTLQRSDVLQPMSDDPNAEWNPRQGVPLLDIVMFDAQRGLAVGAYSLMLRTDDGGVTWTPVDVAAKPADADAAAAIAEESAATDDTIDDAADDDGLNDESWSISSDELTLDEETDPHFNGIVRTGSGALFIVAERGAVFRSRDDGATWQRLQLPYQGSMFGAIGYEGDHVIVFGMRGNAFETTDLGDTWNELDTGTDLSLMGGAALPNGGAVLVGVNGILVHRNAADAPLTTQVFSTEQSGTPVLASVLARGGSDLIVSGERGVGAARLAPN